MTSRSAWLALSLTIAALVAPAVASAADAARGAKLAYTCLGCHGIPNYRNAYPIYRVPKLGGQHTAYMIAALKEYVSQDRPHPTMHAQAVSAAAAAGAEGAATAVDAASSTNTSPAMMLIRPPRTAESAPCTPAYQAAIEAMMAVASTCNPITGRNFRHTRRYPRCKTAKL